MSGCVDKRLGNKLYAWETGILPEGDREEFEVHLLECDYCNQRAQKFQSAAKHIQRDRQVHEAVAALAEPAPQRPASSTLFRSILAVAAVLVILLLKPWQLTFEPSHEATASEDRLAVIHFANLTDPDDPERLGDVIKSLLITDLAQSHYVRVVSNRRLQEIADRKGLANKDDITATALAVTAGAQRMLIGDIAVEDSVTVLTGRLIDVATGDVLESQRVTGAAGESVFELVDRLTVEVRADLALPLEALEETDPRVADVTSHSTEAYRHYLDGLESYSRMYTTEAVLGFERAVEKDTTLAMAWYYLAQIKAPQLLEKAVKHIDRAGRRDQFFIRSLQAVREGNLTLAREELEQAVSQFPEERQALYRLGSYCNQLGDHEAAITWLNQAIEIDSLYKDPYNILAYAHSGLNDYDNAIRAINHYIALAPDEANPYDSRGEIYLNQGKVDSALQSYEQAIAIRPAFASSVRALGNLYLFKRQYAEAEEMYRRMTGSGQKRIRSEGRVQLGYIPVHQGRFNDALGVLDDGIGADRLEGVEDWYTALKHYQKAVILKAQGKPDQALAELEICREIHFRRFPTAVVSFQHMYVSMMADLGQMDIATSIADSLKAALEEHQADLNPYWYAHGAIEYAQGNYEQAETELVRAIADSDDAPATYLLSRLLFEQGRYSYAVALLEPWLEEWSGWQRMLGIQYARAHYLLAASLDQSGRTDEAIARYQQFVDIWSEGDAELIELTAAVERLGVLRGDVP